MKASQPSNRVKLAWLILVWLVITPSLGSQGAASVVTRLIGEQTTFGRQIAVFIAINRYEKLSALVNPVADAQDIKEILVGRYFVDNVIELYDEEATKANINRLFALLVQETRPSDAVFIFYAGHSQLDENSGLGFWIPVDGGTDTLVQVKCHTQVNSRSWIPYQAV